MPNTLTTMDAGILGPRQDLVEPVRRYLAASVSPATRRAYTSRWRQFEAWCSSEGLAPSPATPQVVAMYLSHLADRGLAASTIQQAASAIRAAHEAHGLDTPTSHVLVRQTLRGIRREIGTRTTGKAPVSVRDLRRMVEALGDDNRAVRDAALLVVGFAGALRRSELVGLDHNDVQEVEDGLRVLVKRSKTDQEGEGRVIGLPWGSHPSTCPVRVLRRWIDASGHTDGPLFRQIDRGGWNVLVRKASPRTVGSAVQRAARAIGLDAPTLGGHSLRAGFATAAARAGVPERLIARQTGHRSMEVLRTYIREGTLFEDNPAARVGL